MVFYDYKFLPIGMVKINSLKSYFLHSSLLPLLSSFPLLLYTSMSSVYSVPP